MFQNIKEVLLFPVVKGHKQNKIQTIFSKYKIR